jgi:hypothetical protein
MMIASVYVFRRYKQEKNIMMKNIDNDGYNIMGNSREMKDA